MYQLYDIAVSLPFAANIDVLTNLQSLTKAGPYILVHVEKSNPAECLYETIATYKFELYVDAPSGSYREKFWSTLQSVEEARLRKQLLSTKLLPYGSFGIQVDFRRAGCTTDQPLLSLLKTANVTPAVSASQPTPVAPSAPVPQVLQEVLPEVLVPEDCASPTWTCSDLGANLPVIPSLDHPVKKIKAIFKVIGHGEFFKIMLDELDVNRSLDHLIDTILEHYAVQPRIKRSDLKDGHFWGLHEYGGDMITNDFIEEGGHYILDQVWVGGKEGWINHYKSV